VILDTNAVSAILAGDKRIQTFLPPGERQHLPVVVIAEYQFGMLGSKHRKKLERGFERLESQSIVLPSDRETADMYAAIRHGLKLRGRPIPEIDIWIAALARQHSLEIVSRDSHFDHVEGIRRISW
jgi:tRNA(fMet)-specific endonuclease VapC